MSKEAEVRYFESMTNMERLYVRNKPFSAEQRGEYLIDIGQTLSLIPPPPARLLDLGCGSGWTTALFAKSGYDALGIDIAPAAIDLARETHSDSGAHYEVHDFEAIPFEDVFDICVCYDSLHHAEHPQSVITGIFRALKKAGTILLMEPGQGHHGSAESQRAIEDCGVTEKDMPPSLTAAMLRQAGFSAIAVFPRTRYQMVEKRGTGRVVEILRPFIGERGACLAKTLKNSLWVKRNGVVIARKSL